MTNVIQMPNGQGGHLGDRHRMRGRPGAHVAYARAAHLVVEWYDFGDDAPYESANLLVFDRTAQRCLMEVIGVPQGLTPDALAARLAAEVESYFEVKRLADENGIAFATETDLQP